MSKPPPETDEPAEPEQLWSWSDVEAGAAWAAPAASDRYTRGVVLGDSEMALVQLAEDPLLRRQIVVKTVRAGADTPAARRLLREARITAALAGPGVPQVLDVGVDTHGQTWFAMPALEGETLAARLAGGAPGASLVPHLAAAARVLGGAHRVGIVHRDVKLDNILVDAEGEVTLLDWGIARPESAADDWDGLLSAADQTAAGQVLGTPETMSPEQVIGAAVDRRADVWALGACLAELLTGSSPFARETPAETMRAVVHADPPGVPGPLGPVVARCLQRDPQRRYPDAAALAGAIMEALAPAPSPDPTHRGGRGRVVAGVAGAAVGATLVALLLAWGRPPAPAALPSPAGPDVRDAVLVQTATLAARSGDMVTAELLAAAGLRNGDNPLLRGILAAESSPLVVLSRSPAPDCADLTFSPDGRWLVCADAASTSVFDGRTGAEVWSKPIAFSQMGFSGAHLVGWTDEDTGSRRIHLETGEARPGSVVFDSGGVGMPSLDPSQVLIINARQLRSVSLDSGRRTTFPSEVRYGLALPDGVVLGLGRSAVERWTPEGTPAAPDLPWGPVDPADEPWSAAASVDGRWLVSGSLSGMVREWDLDTGAARRARIADGMVHEVAISPEGTWVAAVDEASRAWLWPRGSAGTRTRIPGRTTRIAFPDEDTLITVGDTRTVWRLHDAAAGPWRDLGAGITGVDWRGDVAAAALGDGTVLRWRPGVDEGERVRLVDGNVTKDVALGPDGAVLAGSSVPDQPSRWLWPDAPSAFSECRRVAWLDGGHGVCQPLKDGPELSGPEGDLRRDVVPTPTALVDTEPVAGRRAAVLIDSEGVVYRLDPTASPPLSTVRRSAGPGPVALDRTGVTYVGRGALVDVFAAGAETPSTLEAPGRVIDLAVSPAGDLLAAGLLDGTVCVWATRDGTLLGLLPGHRERVASVAFDDSGTRLLTGSWDDTVRLWDLRILRAPADRLVEDTEARWGLTAADALSW